MKFECYNITELAEANSYLDNRKYNIKGDTL